MDSFNHTTFLEEQEEHEALNQIFEDLENLKALYENNKDFRDDIGPYYRDSLTYYMLFLLTYLEKDRSKKEAKVRIKEFKNFLKSNDESLKEQFISLRNTIDQIVGDII